jgi:hypothetical protein
MGLVDLLQVAYDHGMKVTPQFFIFTFEELEEHWVDYSR